MSADNYEVIRKVPGKPGHYFVTCEFASDDEWPTDADAWASRVECYPPGEYPSTMTLREAQEFAYNEYSEYGVVYSFPTEVTDASHEV